MDATGSVNLTGFTDSPDFPTTPQAFQFDQPGRDAFYCRMDASGSALLYSTYLGGSDVDEGNAVATDASGRAYVVCTTASTDFPTKSANQLNQSLRDGTLTRFDPLAAGANSVLFSTYLGGNGDDLALGLAVDGNGRAHVTGFTVSFDFPVTAGALLTTQQNSGDSFATKFSSSGTILYSTYLGGSGTEQGRDIALDSTGKMYITGDTKSANFPVTGSAFAGTKKGTSDTADAFLTKLNPSASGAASLLYSTYLGGDDLEFAFGLAVDAAGIAHVVGQTNSSDFPTTPRASQLTRRGTVDAFVCRIDPSRFGVGSLRSSTYLGGSSTEAASGVAIGASGSTVLAGGTFSADFPTLSAFQSASGGPTDVFVTALIPSLPTKPENLRVSTVSASQLKLSWLDLSNNETGFEIQRKSGTGSFAFLALAPPNATTFTDSGLPGAVLTYRVRAVNEEGESVFSNEASGATTSPTAPGNLTSTAFGDFVALKWTDSVGEDTYQIERRRNSDGVFLPIATRVANTTTFADTGLVLNRTFVYRVRAVNVLGVTNSNEATATTLAAPTGLIVTNRAASATQLRLQWVDNSGSFETGFRIQQKSLTSSVFSNVGEVGANVTAFTHSGLAPATQFTYRVFAFNGASQSLFSNNASGSTAPIPKAPDQLTAKALSGTQVRLKWRDNSVFEIGFRIERAEDGGKFTEAGSVGKEGTEFLDGGLSPRTSYTYRVAAFNDGGDSPFSNEAEVRTPAGPRGRLEVADVVRFPSTVVGSQTTAFLRLRNRSRRESLLVISQQPFAPFGASSPLRVKIGPGEIRLLRLIFRPETAGAAEGVLRLHGSDPNHAEVFVRLIGDSVPP